MAESAGRAFTFWAYLALAVASTALFSSLLRPAGPGSAFLDLPADLRAHYFAGKLIKIHSSARVFAFEDGPRDAADETVVLLPGLGCSSYSFRRVVKSLAAAGIRAVSVDLPGAGFSDEVEGAGGESSGGFLSSVLGVYREIKEKGVFWGFDQLVETGAVPEIQRRANKPDGSALQMLGRDVGQVLEAMSLRRPLHLVVHDSACGVVASWASFALGGSVSSITFLDSSPNTAPAFPFRLLETPVVGDLILSSRVAFRWFVKLCCLRPEDGRLVAAESYQALLKEKKAAIVAAGKGLNYSFDLGEWAGSEAMRGVKFQVLWSNTWSDPWIDEGRRVAAKVPMAKFLWHSGGRWPQEDAAEEIAGMIAQFVLSHPKSTEWTEQVLPPSMNKMSSEESGDNRHDHHHFDGHHQENAAGYFSTYGLGQEWGT